MTLTEKKPTEKHLTRSGKSFAVAAFFSFLVSCAAIQDGGLAQSGAGNVVDSDGGTGGVISSGSASAGTTYTPLYLTFGETAHVTSSDSFTAVVTVGKALAVSSEDNGVYKVNNGLDVLP